MNPKVVVIVLHWNSIDVSAQCIGSVLQTDYSNFEILLVDNASEDGSFEILRTTFPKIHFLQNRENLGFAEGNNRGIKVAFSELNAESVVLLNNDTIVDPGWLKPLVDVTMIYPNVGAVGSKIFYFDSPDMIWCTGGSFGDWRGVPNQLRHNEIDKHLPEESYEVDYASGCSILITRKAFEEIGFLDPDYFLYFEETDWCARAKRNGYKIMIAPQSHIWHKVGHSSGSVDAPLHVYYMVRNNYVFLKKNTPDTVKRYLKLLIFISIVMKRYVLYPLIFGTKNELNIRFAIRGLADAFRGKIGKAPDNVPGI